MDARYTRVRNMLTAPEVPRFSGGGIALCHWCQRGAYWSDSFLALLIKDLTSAARYSSPPRRSGGNSTYDKKNVLWDAVISEAAKGSKVSDISQVAGCEETTVYDILKKSGLPTPLQIKKSAQRMKKLKGFGVERAKVVAAKRAGGQSWDTIAASMGAKREHVMAAHINLTGEL